jgi:hypothetical protein
MRVAMIEAVVAVLFVAACADVDPKDAPGCVQGARRCDGDVIQVCLLDAGRRSAVWFDAADCGEPDALFTCVEEETERAATASCQEVAPSSGGPNAEDR